jgi:hypothetical protein
VPSRLELHNKFGHLPLPLLGVKATCVTAAVCPSNTCVNAPDPTVLQKDEETRGAHEETGTTQTKM